MDWLITKELKVVRLQGCYWVSLLDICVIFLFEGYKLRYPNDTNETLDLVLINSDAELDKIHYCHASSYDIKGQLVL